MSDGLCGQKGPHTKPDRVRGDLCCDLTKSETWTNHIVGSEIKTFSLKATMVGSQVLG